MNKFKVILGILITLILNYYSIICIGQTDTSFWFVAPNVSATGGNTPIILRLSSMENASVVTISEPANSSFLTLTEHLAANSSASVDLTNYINNVQNQPPNTVLNYGIYISATEPITAYYDECSAENPEIFSLKGLNALGTNFYISGQNVWTDGYASDAYSAFNIVATQNNTNVTITTTNDVVGHTANTPFTISLNRGQTYCAQGVSQSSTSHLEGSYVTSNNPIAITISDDLSQYVGSCADLMGDQTVPTDVIGTKYIVVEGSLNFPDKIFLTTTQANTSIYINGSTTPLTTIASAGTTYEYDVTTPLTYIEASNQLYVYQVTGFGCEVGSAILPPINCTGSTEISFTRSLNSASAFCELMLIVKTGGENYFVLNGNSNYIQGSSFSVVPGTNGVWKAAKISFNTTDTIPLDVACLIKNTKTRFGMGLLTSSGVVAGASYGFFSNFTFNLHLKSSIKACLTDTLRLTVDSITGATYQWTGPNGFTSTMQNPIIDSLTNLNAGIYSVIATVDSCPSLPAKINVIINPKTSINISPDNPIICKGTTVKISASNAISYIWSPATGLSTTTGTSVTANPITTTTYGIKFTDSLGCKVDTSLIVNVNPFPLISLGNDTAICMGKSIILKAVISPDTLLPAKYLWNDNSTESMLTISKTGLYTVTVTDKNGCIGSDSISVKQSPLPLIHFDKDTVFCKGNSITLIPEINSESMPPFQYIWNDKSQNNNLIVDKTGKYSVTITDSLGCSGSDSVNIISDNVIVSLGKDTSICLGKSIALIAGGNWESYKWQDNSTNEDFIVSKAGVYSVTVTDKNNCSGSDSVYVKEVICCENDIMMPNAFAPNDKDILNVIFKPVYKNNVRNNFSMQIFNRWGAMLFETEDINQGWDGKYNGSICPQGTYVYIIYYKDCNEETVKKIGTVTLIR